MTRPERSTLPNGLRILTTTIPHTRSVSVGFYLGVGSRYEADSEAGIAHFVEHMLFKGSRRWPSPEAIATEIEGRGGVFGGSTGRETSQYYVRVVQSHLDAALDVLSDMLRQPLFPDEEIEKERRIIADELDMIYDQPESLVSVLASEMMWPGHPLGRDVAGSKASVAALGRDHLREFSRRTYTPLNTVVSVAGDAEHERVVESLTRLLGDWAGPAPLPFLPPLPFLEQPMLGMRFKETEQAHLVLSVPGLSRHHPDRFVLALMNTILGEGMSSRFFLELRERQGLAYAVDSSVDFLADTGALEAYAALEPAKCEEALLAILDEWVRMRQEPVPAAELQRAKEYTKGRMLLGLESSMAVAGWWGQQEIVRDEALSADEVIARVDAVTADDVLQMASLCFAGQRVRLALVGPLREEAPFRAILDRAQHILLA